MTTLVFLLLGGCIAASLPIFVSLAGTSFLVLGLYSNIPLQILPQRMVAGVEGFTLLSIPFFLFAANLMGEGGITRRLIDFVTSLAGHMTGGLAVCTVLTCLFFGAITGSTASTLVAVGSLMYPSLIAAGYSSRFSMGLVTCSALLGMIIPPSNAMIVYGAVSRVSVGSLFIAGIGAGLVFASTYCAYCVLYAKLNNVPCRPRASIRQVWAAGRQAVWCLGMPVSILGGIYSGAFTPTESAAVAVAYALFVTMVIYRTLSLRDVWAIAGASAITTARILIMVAAATLFSWLLTVQGITQSIVSPLASLDLERWELLAFSNGLMLIAGMFIDVFSNILIICPLLLPLLTDAGVSELHFGTIATINSDIGNITPPFGLNIFIASGTFKVGYGEVVLAVLPWLGLAILSLMLVTYFPALALWLPEHV